MTRQEVIEALARYRGDAAAISGPGTISRLLWSTGHQPASIYQMDMGYATSMALGLALARPDQRVVGLEGDGSIIAALCVLSTIGRYQPQNLVVLIVDNGVYASAGAGTVKTGAGHGTDIAAVARACGVPAAQALTVTTKDEADRALQRAFAEPGPWVVVAKVDDSDRRLMQDSKSRGVIPYDVVETVGNFRRAMRDRS
ncbi:MAG: aldehyde dehydrogenase [Betaproteobacteria bacterium]|nr:aldehyde dehydrogenase [Betaproteobacteria bacterium]